MTTPASPTETPRRGGRPPFFADPVHARDRDRVHTLVQRLGEAQLSFDLSDVKRAAQAAPPSLVLEQPQHLARYVAALVGSTIVRVPRTVLPGDAAGGPAAAAETADPAVRAHVRGTSRPRTGAPSYVLAHRAPVLAAGGAPCDALECAYVALWIATQVLGHSEVPTRLITAVQDVVPALALDRASPLSNALVALANRRVPLVTKHPADDHGWVRWEAVGGAPVHPALEAWIADARERLPDAERAAHAAAHLGLATGNALVRELVERAIAATVSKDWPVGQAVRARDLAAVAGTDPRAAEITAALRRTGRSLGGALGDVTKTRTVAGVRVRQHVVKLSAEGPPYYDVPSIPGAERRALVVPFRQLLRDARDAELRALDHEVAEARHLVARSGGAAHGPTRPAADTVDTTGPADAAVRRIAAARELAVFARLEALLATAERLARQVTALATRPRQQVRDREAAIRACHDRAGGTGRRAALHDVLREAGACPTELFGVRPLLTGPEYAAWFPAAHLQGRRAAVVLANATPLRRFANPRYTSKQDEDPICAAPTAVDRLDALRYAADVSRARTYPLFHAARRLLGPDVRDARLVAPLLASARPADRQLALHTLVALGAAEAADTCLAILRDAAAPADQVVDALYGLLVLRRITPAEWPAHVRDSASPLVRAAVREVVYAARDGRWLLQTSS